MFILELSKVLMYDIHYDYIKNKYGNNARLLFTDTDSLIYEIKTEDVYEDFNSNKDVFDFSNYSTKSKYYDDSKKSVIAEMKDGTGCAAIQTFIELRPKTFSFLPKNNKHLKAKDMNKNVVSRISHNEYKDVFLSNKSITHLMNRIQSKDHRIGTLDE